MPEVGEQLVQRGGLRHGAREAVEQEAVGGVGLGQPVADHVDGDLVRHELAGVHVPLGLDARAACPAATLARKMSPVEIFGTARCAAMNSAWVPLPAPGGPTSTSLTHHPLAVESPYRRNPS